MDASNNTSADDTAVKGGTADSGDIINGDVELSSGDCVLERYVLANALGEGGWCKVWKAEDKSAQDPARKIVAVKTYREQVLREFTNNELQERFAQEVSTFKLLRAQSGTFRRSTVAGKETRPKDLFVNLLDASSTKNENGDRMPGPAMDGRFYTVLELAEISLEAWILKRPPLSGQLIEQKPLQEIGQVLLSLAQGFSYLHSLDLVHLDLKPANVMRFNGLWKLIDLEGARDIGSSVPTGGITPLYVAPEVAQVSIQQPSTRSSLRSGPLTLRVSFAMDMWSLGVVLLDCLCGRAAFEETLAGFRMTALMESDGTESEEALGMSDWYGWLCDPSPIIFSDFASELQQTTMDSLEELKQLRLLLSKDPSARPSAQALRECLEPLQPVQPVMDCIEEEELVKRRSCCSFLFPAAGHSKRNQPTE
eukprot:TRINITY_DN65285_c0_g1_i1.p1 TRINITY_DN65285_c0_g1~~TRINITY_DN65285_c0_g1_i1.p1  ORF type:complete len:423 (-),score=47.27 TRINITY_DN65285_c0_g1_i1:110-1378(-)